MQPPYHPNQTYGQYNHYNPNPNPYGGYPPSPPRPGMPRPRNPYKRPIRVSVNIICGGLLVMLLMMFTLPQVFYATVEAFDIPYEEIPGVVYWLVNIVIYLLCTVLPIVFVQGMSGMPVRAAYPMRAPEPGLVVAGLFLFLGVSIVGQFITSLISVVFSALFGAAPYAPAIVPPMTPAALILFLLYYTLLPALLEELLFRGVVMQSLRRYGDGFALVISSLLFGLVHGNLIQTPNAILLGLVIGYFALRTGSLLPGMIFHLVNNLVAVLLNLLFTISVERATAINALLYAVYIILGVVGLLWLHTRYRVNFRVARSGYPLRESAKYGAFFSSVCAILLIIACLVITANYFA